MNCRLVFYLSVIVALCHPAIPTKHPNIGSCYYEGTGDKNYVLTFICVENVVNTNYFQNVWSECPGQYGFYKQYIQVIKFEDCDISEIQENLFTVYTDLNIFNISDVGLTTLNVEHFLSNSKQLTNLLVSENKITELAAHVFDEAINLLQVDLSSNEINQIDSNAFPLENQVNELNLSMNRISVLSVKTFQKLKKLQKLSLSYNQIVEIPSFLFHTTEQLMEINLSFNKIASIQQFGFAGALHLTELQLSNNQLTTLNKQMFDNRSKLKHLDISNNRLTILSADTFQMLRSLVYFDLSSNSIKKFDNSSFVNFVKLQHLNLSRTSLSEIKSSTFSQATNLRILDLSNNQLKTLNIDIFSSRASKLETLYIGNNQLRELINFTSECIPNVKIMGIEHNRFTCTYFGHLLMSITPNHLDTFSNSPNCTLVATELNIEDNDFEETSTAAFIGETTKIRKGAISDAKPEPTHSNENQPFSMAFQQDTKHEHHLAVNNRIHGELTTMRQYLLVMICLMSVGFSMIVLLVVWKIFRKQFIGHMNHSDVFYRRDETEFCSTIENNKYEVIDFGKNCTAE